MAIEKRTTDVNTCNFNGYIAVCSISGGRLVLSGYDSISDASQHYCLVCCMSSCQI